MAHSGRPAGTHRIDPMSESGRGAARLPETTPVVSPTTSAETSATTSPTKKAGSNGPVLRGILLDVAPPLIAYYGLRALGATPSRGRARGGWTGLQQPRGDPVRRGRSADRLRPHG